jgi:DNA-binding PadR family transcriptional regulator
LISSICNGILLIKYMTREDAESLSPLALSVLELLDEEPMHPYEMASRMRARHHDEFIRLNFGTLYHTVDQLERNGWIQPGEREKEGRRPERTVYSLTESGRDVLVRTISNLVREPRREYPHFAAGLMFMHHLTAADAAAHLRERATELEAISGKFQSVLRTLLSEGVTRLALIEVEHKIAMLEAELNFVTRLEKEITEGKLEWTVGVSTEVMRRRHGASA